MNRRSEVRALAIGALLLVALPLCAAIRSGMPLADALQQLSGLGVEVVFSSAIVTPSMLVSAAPASADPRDILEELLEPHGLATLESRGGVLIVIRASRSSEREPAAPEPAAVALPRLSEEIVVQPSRISLLMERPGSLLSLAREEIGVLPRLGNDAVRTIATLPGTTTSHVSAEFHIRGGRRDELLVLLDGQEIYSPYHLPDFDNAMSIVGSSALERVSLLTAAFPVRYGDRMAGVLDMETVTPPDRRLLRLSADVLGARIEAADAAANGSLSWLVSARRGSTDFIGRAADVEDPRFWDSFGKVRLRLTPRQSLDLRALVSGDDLSFSEGEESDEGERREHDTRYASSYAWLTHRAIVGEALFVDTTISGSRLYGRRFGLEEEGESAYDVRDTRRMNVAGVMQSWTMQAGERNLLSAGLEYRLFDASFDYASFREFETPLVALRTHLREGEFSFQDRLESERFGVYLSDQFRPTDTLSLEVGARFDGGSSIDDDLVSPRLNVAWAPGDGSNVLRAAWGRFAQSHRPYELMIEDGDDRLYGAELSEHAVLGVEHLFDAGSRLPFSSARLELYRRHVGNPRPRYENLFEPFDPFPEGDFDRVKIEPESATAQGIELMVRGRGNERLRWWFDYSLASSTDRIDGRDVPRSIDQTHTFNLDISYRVGPWSLSTALLHHTGWPATPLTIEQRADDQGELEITPILGAINSDRLPPYYRMDLRVSREWQISLGALTLFLDAHNITMHGNASGREVTIDEDTGALLFDLEHWPGLIATAGVTLEIR